MTKLNPSYERRIRIARDANWIQSNPALADMLGVGVRTIAKDRKAIMAEPAYRSDPKFTIKLTKAQSKWVAEYERSNRNRSPYCREITLAHKGSGSTLRLEGIDIRLADELATWLIGALDDTDEGVGRRNSGYNLIAKLVFTTMPPGERRDNWLDLWDLGFQILHRLIALASSERKDGSSVDAERASDERKDMISYRYNDGGRSAAGYKGTTQDCVTRAFAIGLTDATGLEPDKAYRKVYRAMADAHAVKDRSGRRTARLGMTQSAYRPVAKDLGFERIALPRGPKPTFTDAYRQFGNCIVKTRRHVAAIIDGALHDIGDCRTYQTKGIPAETEERYDFNRDEWYQHEVLPAVPGVEVQRKAMAVWIFKGRRS